MLLFNTYTLMDVVPERIPFIKNPTNEYSDLTAGHF